MSIQALSLFYKPIFVVYALCLLGLYMMALQGTELLY